MSKTIAADAATLPPPTQAEALAYAKLWLDARLKLKELSAKQDKAQKALLAYFQTTEERTVGGVTCWSRKNISTSLQPTVKNLDVDAVLAQLIDDPTFTAFIGERVMGDDVMRRASEDKTFRNSLEKRELISRHLDTTALTKAAQDNVALAKVLKSYKLDPVVVETHSYYLKA